MEREIARLLRGSPPLRGEASRTLLLDRLSRWAGVALDLPAYPTDQQWFLGLLETCRGPLVGLAWLPDAVSDLGVPDPTVAMLRRLVNRWEAYALVEDASEELLRRLESELRAVTPTEVGPAFRRALGGHAVSPPPHCDSAWAVLLWLMGQGAGPLGLPPDMAFLEAVMDRLDPETARQADQWNRQRASARGLAGPLDRERLHRDPRKRPAGPVHLLLQFDLLPRTEQGPAGQPGTDPGRQAEVTWWRQWPETAGFERVGRVVRPVDALEAFTRQVVAELEEEPRARKADVAIEFILSRELLHLRVEHWQADDNPELPSTLGVEYPVVLRSLERHRRSRWHRRWWNLWEQLTEGDSHSVKWGEDEHADKDSWSLLQSLHAEIVADTDTVALVLSGPPDGRAAWAGRELEVALRLGVPVVLWYRGGRTRDVAAAVDAFLHGGQEADRPVGAPRLADLRDRVWRLRTDSYRNATEGPDLGRHLALIWDDPERQPERGR
ncbi:VMAP-C domain-containing protein [Frankia nepalensis]|uniref:VMAP-C domain-containing protein n=1 Tax=Frankia nepalensis TaxID=1836974 RepID=UPI0027DB890B|nr:hypothetical protein [Frankia nepalensis]